MRKKLIARISAASFTALMPVVALAAAQPKAITTASGDLQIQQVAAKVIGFLLILAGALAVIFLIVGGIRYLISAGDSSQIEKAKHTIQYAIIGLIVIIFSYVIVNALVSNLSNQ